MIGNGRVVEDDLFSIVKRLKEIDSTYFVVENYKTKRFEVHSFAQRGNSLALALPYKVLDFRTINHVLKTRRERQDELYKEMELNNAKKEKEELNKIIKKAEREVENAYGKL